MNNNNVNKTV